MSNIGGLEILVVMMVALIVLGPTKLPDAARQVGRAVAELRKISGGFQREMREAIHDPVIEAEARARGAVEATRNVVQDPLGLKNNPSTTTPSSSTPSSSTPSSSTPSSSTPEADTPSGSNGTAAEPKPTPPTEGPSASTDG